MTAPNAQYKLELIAQKEGEEAVASIDEVTKTVTALAEGETTLLVKSAETGDVVRQCPVRVTTAASLEVKEREKPDHKQLILGMDYDVDVLVYDPDGRRIHPSEVGSFKHAFVS